MLTSPTSVRFTRTGRAYHLDIATAADLRNALDLDEALWVATSAPIDTLHLDALFLQLVDTDLDGRIKPPELKDAIRWCLEVLCDARGLDAGDEALAPAAINTSHKTSPICSKRRQIRSTPSTRLGPRNCFRLRSSLSSKSTTESSEVITFAWPAKETPPTSCR